MDWHELAAYTLIGVGVILIIYALLSGYGIYTNLNQTLAYYTITPTNTNSSLNSTIASLGSLGPQLKYIAQDDAALYAEIMILFLIAVVGYAFASLGFKMLNTFVYAPMAPTQQEEEDVEEEQ